MTQVFHPIKCKNAVCLSLKTNQKKQQQKKCYNWYNYTTSETQAGEY